MRQLVKNFFLLFLLAAGAITIFVGCQNKKDKPVIRVAASAVPHGEILQQLVGRMEKQGIILDIVIVDDYHLPNRMLAEKEVDANFFQHAPFLQQYQEQFGGDFVALAQVHLEPMGLYSKKITSLEQLPRRASVAIPSDPSNEARALLLLEKAALITLKRRDLSATVRDIDKNFKEITFLEVESPFLVRTLEDVSLAAITANFALESGLDPKKDALLLEGADSSFVNLLVVRKEDENNPLLLALKKELLSDETKKFIDKRYKGAVLSLPE